MKHQLTSFFTLFLITATIFGQEQAKTLANKEVSHTIYATGNLMGLSDSQSSPVITALSNEMKKNATNTTLLLLGDNVSNTAFSKKDKQAKQHVKSYLNSLKPFSKNTIFIPGASDWDFGVEGLKMQEKYLEKVFDNKNIFQPENGCPLKKVKINEDIDLLLIDSQWALADWDKIPNINANCDIKNKDEFYVEVEHEILKSQGKNIVIATYHPIATNGKYGNGYSFGINPQNINNKYYKEFSARLLTMAQQSKNVVFLGGHENNLQYITRKKIPIIISGSGKNGSNTRENPNSNFHYNDVGYTKIVNYKDGAMEVSFYGISNNFKEPLYTSEIVPPYQKATLTEYHEYDTPKFVYKSIYEPEELEHSSMYKSLWGEHYRKDYITKIKLRAALLDTLYGGLTPIRKGGGHQTNSIRLETNDGREFVMRSAKKSALRFIQYFIFKTHYLEPEIEDNYFIQLLQDYWTTANPYASLTIGDLADAIALYHPNPEVYYIPKQKNLGIYNEDYGDKVYFIEERLTDGHENVKSLGGTNKIEGTTELFERLRRKDKIAINESLYIRTRLFDNIIGDWDRHADQSKWAVTKQENGIDFYEPIPRDRDQVFSNFDGFMLGAITTLSPPLRFMQRYEANYKNTRWFNDAGDDVDFAVLKDHTQKDWLREAKFIKKNLTEDVIDKAFQKFPKEVDQKKIAQIKKAMLGRIDAVEKNAVSFYEYLQSHVIITGTDKDDWFVITRKPNGITNVTAYRIIKGKKDTKFWDRDYDKSITKEIWIHGLDDKDIFEADGEGNNNIKIKIIGGQNNDTYRIKNNNNLRVFDQKSKPNNFETKTHKTLSDDYDLNTYYFKKNRRDVSNFVPLFVFNSDDGLGVGVKYNYKKNSLRRNPFTQNHSLSVLYYDSTTGIDIKYSGEFANIFNKVNLGIDAGYNSPNYTNNFFGFGNETVNLEDEFSIDFYRTRIQKLSFSPSLIFRGYQGSTVKLGAIYENIEVEKTTGRFIETANVDQRIFEGLNYLGAEASYEYKNFDNESKPKNGIDFKLTAGYKENLDTNNGFAYLIPELRLTSKIDKRGILIYATKFKAHLNFKNDFEFFQAATIGNGDGLRGFRDQRFTGKRAFYQDSDLRLRLGRIRNPIIPISYGVYGGFDYGRVWLSNSNSDKWHTSVGTGLFFNIAGFTTANIAYFSSDDGGIVNIGLSLSF
jgi:hypothetical protein